LSKIISIELKFIDEAKENGVRGTFQILKNKNS